ncbi:ZirU family protein [Providencia rettgeri]|nr:ZirU family protein [Providencia rettgeri]
MINHKQQTPNTHKVKLSVLIAGAVLSMAVSTPTLAAAAKTTTVSVTSAATAAVIGHEPVMKTAGTVTAKDENGDKVLGEGDTLTVSGFDFEDADGDKFTISYEWYDGSNVIKDTTDDKLTLTKGLLGKTITVKAIAHTDPHTTEPAVSKAIAAKTYVDIAGTSVTDGSGIATVNGSVVKSVTISGNALVNDKLTATAACHGTCDGSVTYQWQIEDAADSGKYADISGATTKDYTVKSTDQKRKIKVIASSK